MPSINANNIGIALICLSIGFIVLGGIGYAMSPEWLTAQEIREQARKAIPEPVYPPPPTGIEQIKQEPKKVCTQVPEFKNFQIRMRDVCTSVPSPVVTSSGPSNSETNEWKKKVDTIKREYELAVDQEARRISERQRSDFKAYVRDMIQISTGILGLIGGVVALLIGASKGNVPKPGPIKDEPGSA